MLMVGLHLPPGSAYHPSCGSYLYLTSPLVAKQLAISIIERHGAYLSHLISLTLTSPLVAKQLAISIIERHGAYLSHLISLT